MPIVISAGAEDGGGIENLRDAMKNKAPVVCPYCGMAMELVTCRSLMNDSWIGRYHCSDYNCDSCTPITGGHKTEEEAAAVAYEKAQKRHVFIGVDVSGGAE